MYVCVRIMQHGQMPHYTLMHGGSGAVAVRGLGGPLKWPQRILTSAVSEHIKA